MNFYGLKIILKNRQQFTHFSSIYGDSNVKSSMLPCHSGIPQGSCLGPLLFLFFIKKEIGIAEQWFNCNKLTITAKKSKFILYKNQTSHAHVSPLYICNSEITCVGQTCLENTVRFLGVLIDDQLCFSGHIEKLKSKFNSALHVLSTCKKVVLLKIEKSIYSGLFENHLRFGSIIYGAAAQKLLDRISVIQRKALRLVARAPYNAHTDVLFETYNFFKFDDLVHLNQYIFMRQYSN